MKVLQILKTVLAVVGLFALGILTGAFLFRKPAAGKNDEAQKAKEEKGFPKQAYDDILPLFKRAKEFAINFCLKE